MAARFGESGHRWKVSGGIVALLIFCVPGIVFPWGFTGHRIINAKAVMQLPNVMAALKADSLFYAAHASDADNRKNSADTSFFAEAQRHYIDIDSYANYLSLPHNRDSVVASNGWETVKTNGTLPWAIQMVLDSLTAQLRRGDANSVRYTMSDLGHYVADAHQPLHCTANYDGRSTNNSGIHSRYESALINAYSDSIALRVEAIEYVVSPLEFIFGIIYHSNALVDSVLQSDTYAKAVSGWNGSGSPPPAYYAALWQKAHGFTENQFQRATVALASLWYTAWINAGRSTSVDTFVQMFPGRYKVEQNYPNPFNPSTTITFSVRPGVSEALQRTGESGQLGTYWQASISDRVTVKVYDLVGREVATLVDEAMAPGTYRVTFDARGLASGTYLCRLVAGGFVDVKKLILLR